MGRRGTVTPQLDAIIQSEARAARHAHARAVAFRDACLDAYGTIPVIPKWYGARGSCPYVERK